MNINRDYLIINDVKKSNVKLDNGSMFFYITDKNTQNIFVNLVINVSNNDLIQKYANIENAEDYTLTMNIVKPSNTYKVVEGKLHDKEKAIFEFNLSEDCCDEIGTYRCELLTKCNINDREEITTSNKVTYKVKSSVLNDLDDIVEAPEYPLVIQLFDKLSDINQYEEDRRANELARQLAEEQRQARFDTLDADMVDRITAMDDKMVDVENRVSTKEQAVDKLITDTKADIDDYKVAKDQEIDEYKAAKDTEINNAITAQDNKIDTAISEQNDRIALVENNDVAQDNRLDILENKDTLHESRLEAIEVKNVEQDNRLDAIEAIDVAQNSRLDVIEAKNQQQDDRILDIEKTNKRQDMDLKCLFAESKNNMIDVTEEGNSIYLQNSTIGYTLIDEIKGNTLVNCNKEPNKELILNGNINTSGDNTVTLTEGVDGGLVDVALEGNTLVNVSKTKDSTALPLEEELTYLYANTQYTIQFVSDTAITADITLGGTSLLAQSIVTGLNRISITTPSELIDNKLVISGVGANISEVVVTDTDREFSYFEGMKSVGECEELEVNSYNYQGVLVTTNMLEIGGINNSGSFESGTQVYRTSDFIEYPFSYAYINMLNNNYLCRGVHCYDSQKKWIGRIDANKAVLSGTQYIRTNFRHKNFTSFTNVLDDMQFIISNTPMDYTNIPSQSTTQTLNHEPLRGVGGNKDRYVLIDGKWYIERNCGTRAYEEGDKDVYVTDLVNTVYPLETPMYELIYYNPFEVCSGTTHITTNSTIPCNITVKNHGFNCLLKPSTTYTISSNLGLNTVTTPSTLTEDCLRFMDTDTSDVTTMKNVLVLEGDWTTKADLIPANFSGIESCFEQEYDAEKGKYKVNVKVANEDRTKENNITFYIDKPLRGTGDVRDKVYIQDGKVIVERNCIVKTVNGSEKGWELAKDNGNNITFRLQNDLFDDAYVDSPCICNLFIRDMTGGLIKADNSMRITEYDRKQRLYLVPTKEKCTDLQLFKQWLQQNPTTVVYQLAEPVYEEVEYNDVKLFIESFKNSTLFYNSNVPVSSKLYYSYSVPIVDTVAKTASITDEQDSMIIDLATQCAVMEMMLM